MSPEIRSSAMRLAGVGAAALALAGCAGLESTQMMAAKPTTWVGEAVPVGNGTAQVVVKADAAGQPATIAISMTPGALEGLPATLNPDSEEGGWEFPLPVPAEANTGYTEAVVDWNPLGHPPPGIYTTPHFDFHFYVADPDVVEGIEFSGANDPAAMVSDAGLVPRDYQVVPDTAVNRMGVHGIDMTSPEFNGEQFTATFIYGYYKNSLIFVEPMVTLAFLRSKPDFSAPVKTPDHYSVPAYYPTRYSVRYDAAEDRYLLELDDLKQGK